MSVYLLLALQDTQLELTSPIDKGINIGHKLVTLFRLHIDVRSLQQTHDFLFMPFLAHLLGFEQLGPLPLVHCSGPLPRRLLLLIAFPYRYFAFKLPNLVLAFLLQLFHFFVFSLILFHYIPYSIAQVLPFQPNLFLEVFHNRALLFHLENETTLHLSKVILSTF